MWWQIKIKIRTMPICHNLNIRFMIKCGVQGHMRLIKCVQESNTFSQVGRMQEIEHNDSQVHSHFGNQLGIWLSTTNPFRTKDKWSLIGTCNTLLEIFFDNYKILSSHAPNRFELKKIWVLKVLRQQKSQFSNSHLRVMGKNFI